MRCVICGRGGQGIISLNSSLGRLASALGLNAVSAETHGMAMRGGSVYTFLSVGEGACACIGPGEANLVLSADPGEAVRNARFLKPGGTVITDGEMKTDASFKIISVPASKYAALKLGDAKKAGAVLLGAVIREFPEIFPEKESLEIIKNDKKTDYAAVLAGVGGVEWN